MKAMVIGISPEYNYPGTLEKWSSNNTYYASNFGGSFITRAIMREFNAEYIDNFDNINELKNKYDTIIMALATHAHERRDISFYIKILKQLDLRTIVISLGISDYVDLSKSNYKLHPSVIDLLNIASESSNLIGVRGPYTYHLLSQNGFKKNVVPIGCPTLFWNMSPNFNLQLKSNYSNPLVVYQENIIKDNFNLIKNFNSLGQDFKDEIIFTNNLQNDKSLLKLQKKFYDTLENKDEIVNYIKKSCIFPKDFDDWFNLISKADFVFGPRLHGIICSLIQGIPAILTVRDLRTKEMVEMFKIPNIRHENLKNKNFLDLVELTKFEDFYSNYKLRYENFYQFIKENKLISNLENVSTDTFSYTYSDFLTITNSTFAHKKINFLCIKAFLKPINRHFWI